MLKFLKTLKNRSVQLSLFLAIVSTQAELLLTAFLPLSSLHSPNPLISACFLFQAHLRRHIQIHKRTENYNPRQRKLRNVIVQDVGGSPGENEATEAAEASLIAEETDYVPEAAGVQESTNQEPAVAAAGLSAGCIVRVVIESSDVVMENVVSNQNLRHVEAQESFSVPEVLQQPQLVTGVYESTMDMEGIVENISESKT